MSLDFLMPFSVTEQSNYLKETSVKLEVGQWTNLFYFFMPCSELEQSNYSKEMFDELEVARRTSLIFFIMPCFIWE